MSFVRYLLGKKYMRVLLGMNVLVLMFALFGNLVANVVAGPEMTADGMFDSSKHSPMVEAGAVAGVHDEKPQNNSAKPPDGTPTPTTAPVDDSKHKPRKDSYVIAVYGDSMIDTMGDNLPALDSALKKKYPDVKFTYYNYGMGAQNVEDGLNRWDKPYKYKTRNYQPISELGPDIIILGSFAYNPFDPYDRDKHWLTLTRLIEKAKTTGADVYLLAEIAPLRTDFGKGPQGVNWDNATAYEHSGKIIQQLQNAVGLSKNLNVVLVNAFEKSIGNPTKNEGKREYVSISDGIHPSIKGQEFTADEIANALILY